MPLRDDDSKPFGAMLQTLADVYGRDLSTGVVRLYWSALQAYDLAAVRTALDRHVKNPDSGQFFPKPADVIRMIDVGTQDSAMQAWAKVERAMRHVGSHESVVFDDALVHRCIADMGGWPKLCETLEADLPFRSRDFVTLYRGFAMRREIPAYPPHLIGRFEAQNALARQPVAPPVLLGDEAECQRVLRGGSDVPLLQVNRIAGVLALAAK